MDDNVSGTLTSIERFELFLLCIRCTRLCHITIPMSLSNNVTAILSQLHSYSSIIGTHCSPCKHIANPADDIKYDPQVSSELIKYSQVLRSVNTIAESKVEVASKDNTLLYIPVRAITNELDESCEISGVNINEYGASVLSCMLGGFI